MKASILTALCCLLSCSTYVPSLDGAAGAIELASNVSSSQLMAHVSALAQGHTTDVKLDCSDYPVEARLPSCDLSREAAVRYVREAWEGYGLKVTSRYLGAPDDVAKNIETEIVGVNQPTKVVLVAAHLDAYFAGADDNSSGVAALLELARLASSLRFERTLRLVAFDLEERGSVGSTRYVQNGLADDVEIALVLECLGYADSTPGSQRSLIGLPLGPVADFLAIVGNEHSSTYAQQVVALNNAADLMRVTGVLGGGDAIFPLSSALTRSDNGPLWLRGVPALMFTDTADLRNPHYHRETDTADTLDPSFFAHGTQLVVVSAAYFAGVLP